MRRRGMEPMHDEHVNVTPLIDVMLCLLIFFLLCGQMAKEEMSRKVSIPVAENGQAIEEQQGRLVISLVPPARVGEGGEATPSNPDEQPEIWIRGRRVPAGELQAYLRRERAETPDVKVMLRADEAVTYNWISPVLVACAAADIQSVNFATQKK
jgi:biopolymer transport protein ExbD